MSPFALVFFLLASAAMICAPRRWAPMPLLATACYMTLGQGVQLGPFNLPIIRMVMLVGLVRVVFRREPPVGPVTGLDKIMALWAAWALFASAFHNNPVSTLINRLGLVYNTIVFYYLMRCLCRDLGDIVNLLKILALLLVPVAAAMLLEQLTHRNIFASLGGLPDEPSIRNNRPRAQGPFAHAILAGTVGAACATMMLGIWKIHPSRARLGFAASLIIVIASASSGPLLSLGFGLLAAALWYRRHLTRHLRMAAVAGYVLIELVMKAPAYYLIARVDLVGGSTGYHRARLLQVAMEEIRSWWFAGTDYTRHWMPYGVPWSEDHADITNHYLAQGVHGGLPLMVLFILFFVFGFRYVGQVVRATSESHSEQVLPVWTLGASLFVHATSCFSVAYFDQSYFFLCTVLANLASLSSHSQIQCYTADANSDACNSIEDPVPLNSI